MKSKIIIFSLLACSLLYGCNESEVTSAKLDNEGVEEIIVETIEVENIEVEPIVTTYDDVTTSW